MLADAKTAISSASADAKDQLSRVLDQQDHVRSAVVRQQRPRPGAESNQPASIGLNPEGGSNANKIIQERYADSLFGRLNYSISWHSKLVFRFVAQNMRNSMKLTAG